jgi:biopolymer transport protein ExbB
VAGPIGEALIMTALGLLVAIPAVLGFNALVRGNKGISHQLNRFAHDLHAYFVTGARVTASAADGKVLPIKKAS